jgi:Tfp pilus assembly protein PilX
MKPARACPIALPRQRGAAALVVTMMLFFAMVLVAVFVNRNLVFEQRSSANQYRATQAFEAAEAGLEWAQAQLNSGARLGPDCLAASDATATTFRARYLGYTKATAAFVPVTWNNAGNATALQPTCVRTDSGWACSCPAASGPMLAAPAGNGPAPAFTLQFLAGAKPGIVRVIATGCTRLAGACMPGSTVSVDATARVQVDLGLLGGLRTPPAAALTTRGAFDADAALIGVHNPDPDSGIAIHAGGSIAAGHARLSTPAGASLASALAGNDAALAALTTDQFFATYFGLDKAGWQNQPTVARIDCRVACAAAVMSTIAEAGDNAMLWVDGDLTLTGPLALGSVQHPVALVVNGAVAFDGAVLLHGLVYSQSLSWNHTTGTGAALRGAAISEGDYRGDGAPELFHDSELLALLRGNTGSFVRVSGSWRDF